MKKLFFIFFFLFITSVSAQGLLDNSNNDFSQISGIWKDGNNNYYSMHNHDNQLIMIDLFVLESSQDTFSATYVSTDEFGRITLLPISNNSGGVPFEIKFQSDTKATLSVDPISIADGLIRILEKIL